MFKVRKVTVQPGFKLQAYLGDVAGSVPDHYNSVSIAIQ